MEATITKAGVRSSDFFKDRPLHAREAMEKVKSELDAICQNIYWEECTLFGKTPQFPKELKCPTVLRKPTIITTEFLGCDGAMQLNVIDGFLCTTRRIKVKAGTVTPSVVMRITEIDNEDIRLVPCCEAELESDTKKVSTSSIQRRDYSINPVVNEAITILTLKSIIQVLWSYPRKWNNLYWVGELTKSIYFHFGAPVEYEVKGNSCTIFVGNLPFYELQMDNNGLISTINRLVPRALMGLDNGGEENECRYMEAYIHLAVRILNSLTSNTILQFE